MAIRVQTLDGLDDRIEAGPGCCKDALIERGLASHPPDTFHVMCGDEVVDDEPLAAFDGRLLRIVPATAPAQPTRGSRSWFGLDGRRILVLRGERGEVELRLETELSRSNLARVVSADLVKYLDPKLQFTVFPTEVLGWCLKSSPSAVNRTMVNGLDVPDSHGWILRDGDWIDVGNQRSGVFKRILRVHFKDG